MVRNFKEGKLAREEAPQADIKYTCKEWKKETGHRSAVREMGKTGQESETHALEFRSGVIRIPSSFSN